MASQLYQCRVCGIDYASRGREWRKKKKCVWFPKPPPKHVPKRLWQAPAGQLLCGQCRSPTTCQVTGNASGPEKTIAKQKLKLPKTLEEAGEGEVQGQGGEAEDQEAERRQRTQAESDWRLRGLLQGEKGADTDPAGATMCALLFGCSVPS